MTARIITAERRGESMNFKDCAELLKKHDNFLLLTHKNPDGDTVGSAAALCSALRRIGKNACVMPNPGLTEKLKSCIVPFHAPEGYAPDFVLAVDIATEGLLTPGYTGGVDLCIDHHPTNTYYAASTLVCADRSSCGEIVLEIIKALRGSITKREATLLYMALATDNGCFRYSNTNAASFRAAAELLRFGADNAGINMRFFRTASPARIKLEGLIYLSMSYYREGKIAVAEITQDMMRETGASEEDMDDIAALPGRAEGCALSITIREQTDGTCRLSLRSTEEVNSSDICAVFGGGGHALAAGCTISGTPAKVREMILDVINEVWK